MLRSVRQSRRTLHARLLATCLCLLASNAAFARPMRRLFEPTDLELEEPGIAELDLQAGLVRGPDAHRMVVPDFELDLGLTRALELDLDGAFAFEDSAGRSLSFDQASPDNLWLSAKFPILDISDPDAGWGVGLGGQIGTKLPVARQARGVGTEDLALVGLTRGPTQIVVNVGGLIDPAAGPGGRPRAIEGGVDFREQLDADGHWALTAELGGVRFLSNDDDQLSVTAGIAFAPTETLEVSIVGLGGGFASDRYGVLLGVSPKLRLWQ